MTKAAFKRSRRTKKAAAARKRGSKQAAKRTRKATRARKTAPRATRKLATRPKPPALERERRTLTEEPGMPPAMAPETEASYDVSAKNLGYDVTSLALSCAALRTALAASRSP